MTTPQDRLADAISGERRNWHRVEVEPDDIAAVLATMTAQVRLNPGNDRTFTLTEAQTWEVMDAIDDRIESLNDNIANGADLHTADDLRGFREAVATLRDIRAILDGAS